MSWRQQYDDIIAVFNELGIASDARTHALRSSIEPQKVKQVPCLLSDIWVYYSRNRQSTAQISRAGRWKHDSITNAYLSSLPIKFLRKMSGFSGVGEEYYLRRGQVEPPLLLQVIIFPWLKKWELRFRGAASKRTFLEGGLNNIDITGDTFIRLLKH